ncbi:MAG: GNAT family N-acetyltransferase [Chloroflexi bacterium]|nr:GNAT family N-acetyltransferase [Chloroflexota bacterium]
MAAVESAPEGDAHPSALGYRLARATLRDLRAIHRLEQVIFPLDAYTYADLAVLFIFPGMRNLKVVAPDGTLAGFVSAGPGRARRRGWIITIGVAPEHQRRRIGRWLLEAAEQRLGRPEMRLTVRASNAPAITLYKRMGYTVIERKPGYYRNGETGLVMAREVSTSSETR